jgi:endoglucanase
MNYKLLEKICNIPGVSGHEETVQKLVIKELTGHCDELYEDRMGNVIAIRRATAAVNGERPLRVVLAAHVDEYGLMVQQIDDNGFIGFSVISAVEPKMLTGLPVIIYGKEEVRGVIAPVWGDEKIKIEDLRIDTGRDRKWVEKRLAIGDVAILDINLGKLNDKVLSARNFDDRIGTYCMIEAVKRIKSLQVDLYVVSSVQEEVGVRGMPVAAAVIEPDIGLAIDGGVTKDAYKGPPSQHCLMGEGAAVYVMDRLTLGSKKLVDFLLATGAENGIRCQKNYGGGTDASAIQRTGAGALTTTVGVPTRYMHTAVQLCHVDDVEATIELLVRFAESAHRLLPNCNPWQPVK